MKGKQIRLLSMLLGCVNIMVCGKILGELGLACLLVALECFALWWVLLGEGAGAGLGRLLAVKRKKEQLRAVAEIEKRSILTWLLLAVCGVGLMAVSSGTFAQTVFQVPYSRYIILLLAPAIFLRILGEILIGCLNGESVTSPAWISAFLRQVLSLGFLLVFAGVLKQYGKKVSALLLVSAFEAMYGGFGVAIAVDIAEILVFLFLLFIYLGNRRPGKKHNMEGMRYTETYFETMRTLFFTRGNHCLGGILLLVPLWGCTILYQHNTEGTAIAEIGALFGVYGAICGICIFVLCAEALPLASRVGNFIRHQDTRGAKNLFQNGLHMTIINSLFWTTFLAVMCKPVSELFGMEHALMTESVLKTATVVILGVVLSFYCGNVLWELERKWLVFGVWAGGDILSLILFILLYNLGVGPTLAIGYALAGASICTGVTYMILGCRALRAGIHWVNVFGIPVIAVGVVGLISIPVRNLLFVYVGSVMTLTIGLLFAAFVYWTLLLISRSIKEQEIRGMFCRGMIKALGHLYRVF